MKMIEVVSSHISRVGWEPGPPPWVGTMLVEFGRGALYRYHGVSAITALQVVMAPSVGGAFHALVRSGDYPYSRVR